MLFNTLIEVSELEQIQRDCIIIDTRFSLADSTEGACLYQEGHIPGAYFLDLNHDLSSSMTASSGRHPLPDVEALASKLKKIGVNTSSQIVVYDQQAGAFAARLWWLCRWLGLENVAVLNGGMAAWLGSAADTVERPIELSSNIAAICAGSFVACPNPALLVTAQYIEKNLESHNRERPVEALVDARGLERFAGNVEPIDPVAGHVPGAISCSFEKNLNSDGFFRDVKELAENHQAHLGAIHMCGSGVTACHNILACTHAGQPMPRLYAGSWSEWIRDTSRPVAKGYE